MFAKGAEEEQHYCADVCDPSPCQHHDVCELEEDDTCNNNDEPCPPKATCNDKDKDICRGKRCDKFQVRERYYRRTTHYMQMRSDTL